MSVVRFLRSNLGYFIWFCFYFFIAWAMLGESWQAFAWTALLYGVSIAIALSPIGEMLLRWTEHLREVQTSQEKEYLLPLFEEVYQTAKEKFPKLNNKVKLYIDEAMTVNACAIGRKTIAVTKGAIATFSRDELKGVLAHEFGHLVNGDTKALLLNIIGNGFFTLTVLALRIVMAVIRFITGLFDSSGVISFVFWLFNLVVDIYICVIMLVGQLLLSATSRQAEYFADQFSHEIGFSGELIQALYIIQKISMPAKATIMQRLKASHPNTGGRIARLEKLQETA